MSALPTPPLDPNGPNRPRKPPLAKYLEWPPQRRPLKRWQRVVGWVWLGMTLLTLLLVAGVVLLLHNARFHRYLLTTATQKASEALGAQVQARDYRLSWHGISPTVDLYGVVVDGSAPYANPPLLTADHMAVGATITSLLHRSWYLNDAQVDHPVVHLFVDSKGNTNLPQMQKSNSQSQTNVFDLGVRHAALTNGEVYYNDRKSALTADLHDLEFQAGFDPAQKRYSGTLHYRDGHVTYGAYQPAPHALDARFNATPQAFTLESATLTSGQSRLSLKATATDYSNPKVTASYDALVDAGEVRGILNDPTLPTGLLHAAGTLDYANPNNLPLMAVLQVNGDLASDALNVKTPSLATTIRNLGAHYTLAHGNAEVRDLHAGLLGGELTAALTMHDLAGNSHSEMQATLSSVSLADVKPLLNPPPAGKPKGGNAAALNNVALRGTLNATARAAWGKTMNDLVAHADATLNGSVAPQSSAAAIPLNGVVHAQYTAAGKQITLTQSYLKTAQTTLTLNGAVSDHSALQVALDSGDLHEIEAAADIFSQPAPGQAAPQPLGLYGQATFRGAVSGSLTGSPAAPHITGQLNATNLKVRGSSWKLLRASLDATPSAASLQNGELDPADRGHITFSARVGLHQWSFNENSPIQASLMAGQVNVAGLTRLAGSTAPVTGTLAANVQLSGTELNPVGAGTVNLTQATVANEPVKALNLTFQGTGTQVDAKLTAQLPAGNATGTVTYFPKQQGYAVKLAADGIKLEQLQTVKDKNLQLAGVLNLNASGRGTVKDPQLTASLEIPQLTAQGQTISGMKLQANVANHVATFNLDSQVVNTYAKAHGTIQLTGDYLADAAFDTQAIPLGPLVALYAPTQAGSLTGQTELHATLRGPLKNKAAVEAHITVPQLAVNYKNTVQLAAAGPIHADYANGVLTLQPGAVRGTDTDLHFQGRIPVVGNGPIAVLLKGTVDLRLAQLVDPDVSSSGQLRFNIDSTGARANPDIQGQIEVVNANFATTDAPLGVQNGNGTLTLTRDRLNITKLTATVGGGAVQLSGGVVYKPKIQFDMAAAATNIRLLYPDGVRSGMSANLALTGTPESSLLSGQVRVNKLSFTPDFDLMSFASQFSGTTMPPPASGFTTDMKLNIAVESTTGINLVSRTLSLDGAARLRVAGTAADPVILGRVNIDGGDMIFQGNRYVLQGGTIDFVNPIETTPVVNVNVNTTIQQYNIQLRFWGPVDHMHTNYASDPALPPSDIINLIAFGKTSEASAANPTPGTLGAESAIASQVSGQVTNRLEKIAGISQLSIDPELGGQGSQQNPGARIGIQQRVTSKIFVTFATDVNSTQNAEIKVEYKVSPRLSINAVRDQNGGFAMDGQIHKKW